MKRHRMKRMRKGKAYGAGSMMYELERAIEESAVRDGYAKRHGRVRFPSVKVPGD